MNDGKEVETTEDVETNIEEDGEEIKDSSELREDLQHIVDSFLHDGEPVPSDAAGAAGGDASAEQHDG